MKIIIDVDVLMLVIIIKLREALSSVERLLAKTRAKFELINWALMRDY